MKSEKDPELLNCINEVYDRTDMSWCKKLDHVLDFLRKNRDLKSFHITIDPFDDNIKNEDIAYDIIQTEKARAAGELEEVDITDLPL